MKIESLPQARLYLNKKLYWDETSNRYVFHRSGVLTEVYRGQLDFDHNYDYQPIEFYKNLRTKL